jgi:hypothetical protein
MAADVARCARMRGWDEETEGGAFQLGRAGARAGGDEADMTGRATSIEGLRAIRRFAHIDLSLRIAP